MYVYMFFSIKIVLFQAPSCGLIFIKNKKGIKLCKKISCSGHGDIVSWKGGQIILKSLLPIKKNPHDHCRGRLRLPNSMGNTLKISLVCVGPVAAVQLLYLLLNCVLLSYVAGSE
jgi:hypothetical protein